MAAPKGNQFWKIRSKHGREKLFETPELLLESAQEYFEWCDNNPFVSTKTVTSDKFTTNEEKPTLRPYSRGGWYIYIGCSDSWLKAFKKTCSQDFLTVIESVENIIDTQQWDGATIGVFNSNIIARTLGLMDKQDITTNGDKINTKITIDITMPDGKIIDDFKID